MIFDVADAIKIPFMPISHLPSMASGKNRITVRKADITTLGNG